ncbi:SRPBCC family protein [Aquimarina muelleri]|uniref:Cell division protein n=1 Tax=Aquimarina muelleri TaxID=279356 RepID=A0A918JUS0_9FLAO|nr:SRPBCC family protein [Aquimarina muelleri]MCX2762182.1 SRPBCC family protein [Aquimarina muelleri]GGX16774.1 hypothetical protein GCM10007384_17870 [Aquimarina muelleri]
MTTIYLETEIKAPSHQVFDLSRSIDFHIISAKKTKEKVIAGRTSGLIGLKETVTWKGKHFGVYLTHKSLITAFEYPNNFTDEMVKGYFVYFKHQHHFYKIKSGTKMVDKLQYKIPLGFLGKLLDVFFLKKYLTKFLVSRNHAIQLHLENITKQ